MDGADVCRYFGGRRYGINIDPTGGAKAAVIKGKASDRCRMFARTRYGCASWPRVALLIWTVREKYSRADSSNGWNMIRTTSEANKTVHRFSFDSGHRRRSYLP